MRPLLIASLLLVPAPVLAQAAPQGVDGRVGKLEREMRAVQRKVFGSTGNALVEAEITPPAPTATPAGNPASSAINDLTARVDALERQLAQMTGQIEQNAFKLRQLEEAMTALRTNTDGRIKVLEAPSAPAASAAVERPAPTVEAPPRRVGATTTAPAAPAPAAATTTAATAASTGDPGEDAYLAGYRLWEQKKYREAQAALKAAATKYPKHRRASYAQNLLGRAYLDEGRPALAAEALYANYRTNPRGERAPDSLYFLGQALTQLKKPKEACQVYDELRDVYGETINASLKARVAEGRTAAKCDA